MPRKGGLIIKNLSPFFVAFNCGALSLALEVILSRLALRGVGSGAYASAITITVFLIGLSLGALAAQKCSAATRLKIVRYTPAALVLFTILLASNNAYLIDWATVSVALFLPSFCSAIFLSSLASSYDDHSANLIYCNSNLGSWCGALLAGFVLLPFWGINQSLLALALAASPAALLAIALQMQLDSDEFAHYESCSLLSGIFLFSGGLILTVLECDWIRLSSLILGSSTQAIAATVASVVGALALGNALAVRLAKKPRHIVLFRAIALTLSALSCLLCLVCTAYLPQIFQQMRAALIFAGDQWQYFLPRFLATALLAVPTSFSIGLLFPLFTNRLSQNDWRKAYTASAAGSAVGPALFTFVLIEHSFCQSSLEGTLRLSAIALAALALAAVTQAIMHRRSLTLATAILLFLLLPALILPVVSPPLNVQKLVSGMAYFPATEEALEQVKLEEQFLPLRFYKDGRNSTISVEENKFKNVLILKSDGKVEATIPAALDKPAGGSDLPTQSLLSLLPALIHGGDHLNCLIIGQGSGTTSGIAATLPNIEKIDIVEIEPQIVEASRLFPYAPQSEKINITIADARTYLRRAKPYDLIVSQPAEPWVAGSSALFTREFFQLTRSRLAQGGVMTQWLQLYGLTKEELICALKTFVSVYPHTTIFHRPGAGEIIMVATTEPTKSLDKKLFSAEPYRAKLAAAGVGSWQSLKQAQLLSADALEKFLGGQANSVVNTDDNLELEYGTGRYLNSKDNDQQKRAESNLALLQSEKRNAFRPILTEEQVDAELSADASAYSLINLKAKYLLSTGKTGEALVMLQKSNRLNPSCFSTHELLALSLAFAAKFEEALSETQTAHQLNGNSCRPYLIAASIYQVMGNVERARWNLNKAGQICGGSEILSRITLAPENRPPDFNARTGLPSGTLKSNLTRLLQVAGE